MAEEEVSTGNKVTEDRAMEIVFYDVETSVPGMKGEGFELLEFGAVVVSAKGLEELDSFTTLVRPRSFAAVSPRSIACNGIIKESLINAPSFQQVADRVHSLLHGRVWAGHNILRFDNLRIKEAFASIGKPGPEAAGFIDTLPLLRKTFGQRAGNLKMSTLASYFGLGKQEHRSLSDIRLNLEVLKLCSTVVLLESNFPEYYRVEPRSTRRRSTGDAFNLNLLKVSLEECLEQEATTHAAITVMQQTSEQDGQEVIKKLEIAVAGTATKEEATDGFLRPHNVCLDSLEAVADGQWINLMHGSQRLCIRELNAMVKFSVSERFAFTDTGKPTFTLVIIPSPELLAIVKYCEIIVKSKCREMEVEAVWQPVLVKNGTGDEALRIKIGTIGEGDSASYATEMCKRKADGAIEQVSLQNVEVRSFQQMFPVGCFVDAALHCDAYAFQGGKLGLRLLAKQLILN